MIAQRLILLALAGLMALPAFGRDLKLATWDAGLSRQGPGQAWAALAKPDAQVTAALQVLVALDADVLVLTDTDYDASGALVQALQAALTAQGLDYAQGLALRPNTGVPTGLDMDHDGRMGGPGDAQGWGRFPGQGGIVLLSKWPIQTQALQDYSGFLWRDLPGADLPADMTPDQAALQRLATTGFYQVPITVQGRDLTLLIYAATPPVFDGDEDRNGRRNADETAFWAHLLAGDLPFAAPSDPVVLLGQPNLDPMDGEGRPQALRGLMADPRLQDPAPRGASGRVEPGQTGDPALDTMLMKDGRGLRLDMILPGASLQVTGAGVFWPAPGDPLADAVAVASPHRAVWVTLAWP